MRLRHLVRNVWKNYSLLRAYENDLVSTLTLSGRGIDLGAKSKDAKYYEFMDMTNVRQMDFVDFFHSGNGVIQVDLEKPFPIEDGLYDFVLMFNVMEHIYDYQNLIAESRRILSDTGVIHGIVPLMWHFHADPNDYFRFTWQALERILQNNGFGQPTIKPIACGPFKVAASQVGHVVRLRPLRLMLYMAGISVDKVFSRISSGAENFAMAYYFSAHARS